jgi:hypothetical protein
VSEEVLAAYEVEKENWLRNLSAARAARIRALLRGERVDVDASEVVLGYRLRQHHVGVVCWLPEAEAGGSSLARLEDATSEVARRAACEGRPIFLPQDESSAWAWLPLGARDTFAVPALRGGSGQGPGAASPSAPSAPALPASAVPTGRRWAPTRSRWPPVGRGRR